MITALAMVARGFAGMIALIARAIAVLATLASTFGIRGANRRHIGRQQCSCAERQGTSEDGYQGFSHVCSPPEGAGGA
ncbi:hypothetical protein D9M71_661390 [compost metagenome]